MEKIERKSILEKAHDFLDSKKGRVLLNFLYSWGAAVVILGALFKLTHIEGANLMLFIGMGTEVLVFFISGFERPFIPELSKEEEDVSPVMARNTSVIYSSPEMLVEPSSDRGFAKAAETRQQESNIGNRLGGKEIDTLSVETVTSEYIEQVRDLTEKLLRVTKQSELMDRNTEEIDALGRNMISLNTFYQMHLRSVSSQMENIDQVNVQTKRMLEQIEELNKVYARMVEAMKVNVQSGPTKI